MEQSYLDNNGTTQIDPRVMEAMIEELKLGPSNPSSIHTPGRAAKIRLEKARDSIADYLGVNPTELIFTSSGTEAMNMAIHGLKPHGEIISTKIEHACIYNTLQRMENPIVYLPVGKEGHIHLKDLEESIGPKTRLIVLGAVNSETGVKNPINEIASIAQKHQIPLIIDGVALLGKEIFTIPAGVTAMIFSAHKIHGPKGIGMLFIRKGTKLSPLLTGGAQERQRRAGTENLMGIIGFAKAIELLKTELPEAATRMAKLRDQLEQGLEGVHINGTGPRVCNTSSITFPGIDGEGLLIQLDRKQIAASMGSACSSASLEPSRVLLNMGLSKDQALSSLRFSLSRFTQPSEVLKLLDLLKVFAREKSLLPETY